MSLHQQTAVVVTAEGGVVAEIIVTALSEEHIVAATALLSNLVGHTINTSRLESNTEPVIGFKAGRRCPVSGGNRGGVDATEAALLGYTDAVISDMGKMMGRPADEASAPEGAPPAEPLPASQAGLVNTELPDLPGIPDDTEYSGDDMPYGHPDDETGAAEEGFGLEWAWTKNPAALAQATLRARAVRQLDVGAALEAELKSVRRDVRHAQKLAALERELRRQRKQVQHLAAVLTLMTNAAESEAAAVHCTDADDSEWLASWADADPWGRQLVSHARVELGRARS